MKFKYYHTLKNIYIAERVCGWSDNLVFSRLKTVTCDVFTVRRFAKFTKSSSVFPPWSCSTRQTGTNSIMGTFNSQYFWFFWVLILFVNKLRLVVGFFFYSELSGFNNICKLAPTQNNILTTVPSRMIVLGFWDQGYLNSKSDVPFFIYMCIMGRFHTRFVH